MRFDGPVLHQSGGGILHADRVVSGLQRLAVEHGATVRAGARVVRVSLTDGGAPVLLATDDGSVLARHVIVTVGPWVHRLLAGVVPLPSITVTQEQPRIFEPRDDAAHEASDWPCFVHWRDDDGDWGQHESYGLYEAGAGVKVGLHASGPEIDPDRRDFTPEPERDDALRAYVRDWFPGLDPNRSTPISCLYDNTENGDFVIDRFGPLTVATGFNGEGFKFVPVVGELLRDLAIAAADPPAMFTVARHLAAST
jgi:sarcosine oxidase